MEWYLYIKVCCLGVVNTGLFTGGIFKFTVMFPPHYPSVPPKLRFTSEVYHPLITDHGDFSLRALGKWTSQIFITNVLHFVKHSFKTKGLEGLREAWCVNPDAFRLYSPLSLPWIVADCGVVGSEIDLMCLEFRRDNVLCWVRVRQCCTILLAKKMRTQHSASTK